MKKFFLVVAMGCVMAMSATLVSCDPNKAQCWKLQATFEGGAVQEEYFYGTGVEADARLEQMHQMGAIKIQSAINGNTVMVNPSLTNRPDGPAGSNSTPSCLLATRPSATKEIQMNNLHLGVRG